MLLATAKQARQGKALPGGGPLERVIKGLPVPGGVVRVAAARQLRRFARSLALEGTGEVGWQRRNDRARATAGSGPGQGLDGLLIPDADGKVLHQATGPAWKNAAATFAHALAGDVDGVVSEDLISTFMMAEGRTAVEVEQAVESVRTYEMADGVDLAELLVPQLSLSRMVGEIETVDLVLLKRALTAMGSVQAGHGVLSVQALHAFVLREVGPTELDTLLPESMRRIPDGVDELRQHPAWTWLSRMIPSTRYWLAQTVLVAMIAVRDLQLLAVLEDYRDQLLTVIGFPALAQVPGIDQADPQP